MAFETAAGTTFHPTSSAKAAASDETLIGLIANGDKDAMRVLFARHNVRVFRFLLRIISDEAMAEDLLNEAFVDVWRHAGRFEGRSRASTWILAIARHKALGSLRRRSFDELDDDIGEMIEDPADDPETVMQKTDLGAIMRDCLKQLSSAHREVIDLVYYHEQSIDEVAQITGLPRNTVKTRVFYARKRMTELMCERGLEANCM
jgi:RNA polymerase sigma-70 factor, ECF subfamily